MAGNTTMPCHRRLLLLLNNPPIIRHNSPHSTHANHRRQHGNSRRCPHSNSNQFPRWGWAVHWAIHKEWITITTMLRSRPNPSHNYARHVCNNYARNACVVNNVASGRISRPPSGAKQPNRAREVKQLIPLVPNHLCGLVPPCHQYHRACPRRCRLPQTHPSPLSSCSLFHLHPLARAALAFHNPRQDRRRIPVCSTGHVSARPV